MRTKTVLLFSLILVACSVCMLAGAEPAPPPTRLIPPDALIALDVTQPRAVLNLLLDPRFIAAVKSSPVYQRQSSQEGFAQFSAVVAYLESSLGTDWKTAVGKLVGQRVAFALLPGDALVLTIDAEDGPMLARLHEILLTFARDEAAKQGQPDRVKSASYNGIAGWTFGGDEAHAIVGNRLLVSNKAEALKRVLDLQANPALPSLAGQPAFQAAQRAAGSNAAVLFANMQLIKQHPPLQKALADGGNPMVALLFAGVREALRDATWLCSACKSNRTR